MVQRLSKTFGAAGMVAATVGTVVVAQKLGVGDGAVAGAFLLASAFGLFARDTLAHCVQGKAKDIAAFAFVGAALGAGLGGMSGCLGEGQQCTGLFPSVTIPVLTKP